MIKGRFFNSLLFSLMLGMAPAWADVVDIDTIPPENKS